MPWCEECAKYHAPSAMNADGTCPVCGGAVAESEAQAARAVSEEAAPWHFKLLVGATVVYLGWRFVQLFA
jgi:hypothetical protein